MNIKTIVTLLVAIAVLVGLFLVLKPDPQTKEASTTVQPAAVASATPTISPNTFTFVVSGGKVTAPPAFSVKQGSEVTIQVISDVADEVHLHGYDLSKPVAPGQTFELKFVAATAGRFEIELEKAGLTLGNLEVQPK